MELETHQTVSTRPLLVVVTVDSATLSLLPAVAGLPLSSSFALSFSLLGDFVVASAAPSPLLAAAGLPFSSTLALGFSLFGDFDATNGGGGIPDFGVPRALLLGVEAPLLGVVDVVGGSGDLGALGDLGTTVGLGDSGALLVECVVSLSLKSPTYKLLSELFPLSL